MRTNANKDVHKMKRDPYKTLVRTVVILALAVAVGVGVFYLCSVAVTNDYINTRNNIEQMNEQGEIEFNARMNELRASNTSAAAGAETNVVSGDLPYWEATLDGKLWRVEDEGTAGLENTSTITLERSALINGGLLLVNTWHALPDDFSDAELIAVGTTSGFKIQVQDNNVLLFPPAYKALEEAINAAAEVGLEHYIVREAYRSNATQTSLFQSAMEDLSSRYSGNVLIEQTKKKVNYPGTSDYQSGMSFRLDVYESGNSELNNKKFQAETEQAAWLTENCWRYGIIFRFPSADFPNENWEDKSFKTGVSSQLNLYRYVGKAHAAAMKVMDLCLEEYIEFLIAHPHVCIYEDGALKYEIVRLPMADGATEMALPVPNPASDYQASLDNMGGVVMAYTYK